MIGTILFLTIFFLILVVTYINDRVEKCYELMCEIDNLAFSTIKNHLLWLRERDDLGELSDDEFEVELIIIRHDEMRAVWDSIDLEKILRRAIFSFKPITKENLLTQEQLNLIYGKL